MIREKYQTFQNWENGGFSENFENEFSEWILWIVDLNFVDGR